MKIFGNFGLRHGFMVLTQKTELIEKRAPANSLVSRQCFIAFKIAMKGMG